MPIIGLKKDVFVLVPGLVQSWAAIVMGILSGSIPWVSMMILHKKSKLLQKVCSIVSHSCPFIFVAVPHIYYASSLYRYRYR